MYLISYIDLQTEKNAFKKLGHQHIVKLIGYYDGEGQTSLILEYMPKTLSKTIDGNSLLSVLNFLLNGVLLVDLYA